VAIKVEVTEQLEKFDGCDASVDLSFSREKQSVLLRFTREEFLSKVTLGRK
jgi:hypothetical protein